LDTPVQPGETGGAPWLGAAAFRRKGPDPKTKAPVAARPVLGRHEALYRLSSFRRSSSGSLAKFAAMRCGRGFELRIT